MVKLKVKYLDSNGKEIGTGTVEASDIFAALEAAADMHMKTGLKQRLLEQFGSNVGRVCKISLYNKNKFVISGYPKIKTNGKN